MKFESSKMLQLLRKSRNATPPTTSSSKPSKKKRPKKDDKHEKDVLRLTFQEPFPCGFKAYAFIKNDPRYLIRLCKESKWKYVERCCIIFSEILKANLSSSSKATEDEELLAAKTRQQLLETDAWGNTALHVACYYRPPVKVIERILKTSRYAFSDGPIRLLSLLNDKGSIPLVVACQSGASHKVIKKLLQNGKSLATHADYEGSSAFVGLYNRYTLIQKLPALRNRFVPLKDIQDKDELSLPTTRSSPATTSINGDAKLQTTSNESNQQRISSFQRLFGDWIDFDEDEDPLAPATGDAEAAAAKTTPVFPYFWNIIEELMHAAWISSPEVKTTECISNLHRVAFLADILPIQISDMIIRTHADQIVRDNDDDDDDVMHKPLQLAFMRRISSHPKVRKQHAHVIKSLIAMDPPVFVAKSFSTTVFCKAIAMGHYWNLSDGHGCIEELEGPIQSLFLQCPEVLSKRDKETGLYPFMLAATVSTMEVDSKEDKEEDRQGDLLEDDADRLQLDTIYNLLRASPELIR